MIVAILSESPADEAALRVLVDGILKQKTFPAVPPFRILARGWEAVLQRVPSFVKHLHFQTDAVGFLITLDSDHTTVHDETHERTPGGDKDCRLCKLIALIDETQGHLSARPCGVPLKIAYGVAVPSIEAWYLANVEHGVSEAAWKSGAFPYTKPQLKEKAYGTSRPPLDDEQRLAVNHVRALVESGKLELLEQRFPAGFGTLAKCLRSW